MNTENIKDLISELEKVWKHLSDCLIGMEISDPRWKPAVEWLNRNREFQK